MHNLKKTNLSATFLQIIFTSVKGFTLVQWCSKDFKDELADKVQSLKSIYSAGFDEKTLSTN